MTPLPPTLHLHTQLTTANFFVSLSVCAHLPTYAAAPLSDPDARKARKKLRRACDYCTMKKVRPPHNRFAVTGDGTGIFQSFFCSGSSMCDGATAGNAAKYQICVLCVLHVAACTVYGDCLSVSSAFRGMYRNATENNYEWCVCDGPVIRGGVFSVVAEPCSRKQTPYTTNQNNCSCDKPVLYMVNHR